MKFRNEIFYKNIKTYDQFGIPESITEDLKIRGVLPVIEYVLGLANQLRDVQEELNNNLLRSSARGEYLRDYLSADGINLTGLPEPVQAMLGLILRNVSPYYFTPEQFAIIKRALNDIGFCIYPDRENTLVYSLLKQSEISASTAKKIGASVRPPARDLKVYINPIDNKEITLYNGLKSIAETIIAIVVTDIYPWLKKDTSIDLEGRAQFGYGFFRDGFTKEKTIWLGHFKRGVAHTSLASEDGVIWKSYSENQVDAGIVEGDYLNFANVTMPVGDELIPLMIGGSLSGNRVSDIYHRRQEYAGLGSPYTFRKIHTGEFAPREATGAVWFKDHLWVIGGLGQDLADCADIWKSPMTSADRTFTLVDDTPPWSFKDDTDKDVYGHCLVVFQDKMWFLGGRKTTGAFYNNIYSSEDGVTWNQKQTPPWSPRAFFGTVVVSGRLYVLGGEFFNKTDLITTVFNDVWYTEDGVNWVEERRAGFSPRSRFGYLSDDEKGKIYICGGQNENGDKYNDFWEHYILK